MATTGDIRDIMDLGHNGPRPPAPPKKKKKFADLGHRLSGMSREVQALMGDSVPPVAIIENPKYKSKPSLAMKMFKPRHWDDREFTHAARTDGLVLRHWKRAIPGVSSAPAVAPVDSEVTDGDNSAPEQEGRYEDDFPSEKWNVQVNVVGYTPDQYERYLKSDDWTKEETDYLMGLCRLYDLRWLLIADRYDASEIQHTPVAVDGEGTNVQAFTARSMESLKARYYQISAKMLEAITPASQMTNTEFQLWEKMRNFDAKAEATRKTLAEKLFERTKDEAEEEKVLLEELHRITKHEEDFIKMRKDLYSRLETAPSLRRNERGEEQSTAVYQSSHGLSMLLSTLLAKERKLKRAMPNGDTASATATPVDQKRPAGQYNRRETMDSQADDAATSKKGSMSQPMVKTLTPAEQAKYGVSHPQERLTSGVMFRHEKINRITTAKSQVQTQKIQLALTELGIPPRLLMPTERVCREFERLVAEVQLLLDARRGLEKIASEVKVLEEHKKIRLGEVEGEKKPGQDAMEVDEANTKSDQKSVVKQEANIDESEANIDESGVDDSKIVGEGEEEEDDDDEEGDNDDDNNNDGEGEDDEDIDQSRVADDDDDDDDVDQSMANLDNGIEEDDSEAGDDEDAVDEEEEEDDADDDDGPGLEDLEKANEVTDDDEEDGDGPDDGDNADIEDEEDGSEQADGEEQEDDDPDADADAEAEIDESVANGLGEDEDVEEDVAKVEERDRPSPAHRSHKRSASVISEASRTGSNRSGFGRKKRR